MLGELTGHLSPCDSLCTPALAGTLLLPGTALPQPHHKLRVCRASSAAKIMPRNPLYTSCTGRCHQG